MAMTTVSCSWCHCMVVAGTRYCPDCGHRADKPRMDCDCSTCSRSRALTRDEHEALDENARRRPRVGRGDRSGPQVFPGGWSQMSLFERDV